MEGSKFTVVVTEPMNRVGIDWLRTLGVNVVELPPGATLSDLMKIIEDVDGLLTRGNIPVTRELMEKSPRLKVVGVHGIGCDHIDMDAARELGKRVCHTPDALTVTVAEMTLSMILAAVRNLVAADKAVRSGEWNRKYGDLIGVELAGSTVGIVGLGRIGAATAKLVRAFDANVVYWSRRRKPALEESLGIEYRELDDLLKESDLISLHLTLAPETSRIIDARSFTLMKPGVRIVNTSRGGVMDTEALIEALNSGKVACAALDVFDEEPLNPDSPLNSMDNVILAPHLGASNLQGMQRMSSQVAEGVYKVLQGEEPDHPII